MKLKKYIIMLREKILSGDATQELIEQYQFAKAYQQGEIAVSHLRQKLIEQEIAKIYTHGAEVRILADYCRYPDNIEVQDAFFAHEEYVEECKLTVDKNLSSYRSILLANINY